MHGDFLKETVPIQILTSEEKPIIPINLAFLGLDVLGIHLKKGDEWLYGVYRDGQKIGFLYEGGKMSREDQELYARRYLPDLINTLHYFKEKFKGKIGYYFSYADMYAVVGFCGNKNIIERQ